MELLKRELESATEIQLKTVPAWLISERWEGASLYPAICLAFAGFLHMGEFTWARGELNAKFQTWYITQGSVLLSEDWVQLSLPASKTDPFRQVVTLTIAATGGEACAVAALKQLFGKFPAPLNSLLFDTGHEFSQQFVADSFRNIL